MHLLYVRLPPTHVLLKRIAFAAVFLTSELLLLRLLGTLSIVSISLKREAKPKNNYSFFLYTTYSGHLVPAARSAYILTVKNTCQSSTPIAGGL